MNPQHHHVVVLGASPKPMRYAYQAVRMLKAKGYRITPVHPRAQTIDGLPVTASLAEVARPVHTLTLYVGPERLRSQVQAVLELRPGRVIFNPGAESDALAAGLDQAGIPYTYGCTLVMLQTGQF
jgi:predicted CoA-binding protein